MMQTLWALAQIFTQLSVLAFGGGNTILPEMQRQVVDVHGWMTAADFSALFALGQAAPGPNLMVVTLVGWHVAGWSGMLVTTLAVRAVLDHYRDRAGIVGTLQGPALARHRAGRHLSMTVGLVAASASLITESSVHSWLLGAITAAVAILGSVTRIHPLWLLFAGSMVGLLGIG